MGKVYISQNTLKRIPFYLDYLKKMKAQGEVYLSSTAIAKSLELNDVQVRKDLALISRTGGKPKVGYEIDELLTDISLFLGMKNNNKSVLIGVGSLGTALLNYQGFAEYGLEIVAAFDKNPDKINQKVGRYTIKSLAELPSFCKKHEIHVGIITVPAVHAQEACDNLVRSGVKAIWNFAPTKLNVNKDIIVQNENMASSLVILSRHLNETRH